MGWRRDLIHLRALARQAEKDRRRALRNGWAPPPAPDARTSRALVALAVVFAMPFVLLLALVVFAIVLRVTGRHLDPVAHADMAIPVAIAATDAGRSTARPSASSTTRRRAAPRTEPAQRQAWRPQIPRRCRTHRSSSWSRR